MSFNLGKKMGAARDFDQDENLDFSDLSDTNQSALEKAKSRWGNAEVIRGDDGYNPSDLASAEKFVYGNKLEFGN